MNSVEQQQAFFETAPRIPQRQPENSANETVRPADRNREDGETGASFPHLLIEQREQREQPVKSAAATQEAAAEPAASMDLTGQETAALAGQNTAANKLDTLSDQQAAVLSDQTSMNWDPTATAVQDPAEIAGQIATAAVVSDVPAILAQGLAVQAQQPDTSQTGPAVAAQPVGQQLLAQGAATPGPAAAMAATIETAVAEVATVATESTEATKITASELETTAKGRETYTQVPVVSESQMVADSLKNEARHQSAATAQTGVAQNTELHTAIAASAEQSGAETAPEAEGNPAPESQTASTAVEAQSVPESLTADTNSSLPQETVAVNSAATVDSETVVAAPVTPEAQMVNRPDGTVTQTTQNQFGSDPTVAKDIRQQVVRHLGAELNDITGQQKITIKLNPEGLGQVELNFDARDDRLSVSISASNPEAEAALRDNMKDLTDRIVERSARFSHVDVRVEIKDGADTRQDNKNDQKQDQKQDGRRDNAKQDGNHGQNGQGQQDQQSARAQQAWESAMSWQLADQLANEEG